MIVSNPPYIPFSQISSLEPSVQFYDPLNALTDYHNGMYFYQRIFDISKKILNKNGLILLEFGDERQSRDIINIFKNFDHIIVNDKNNQPRVIILQ